MFFSERCSQRIEVECINSFDNDLDQAVKFIDNKGNLFEPFTSGGDYCKKRKKKSR